MLFCSQLNPWHLRGSVGVGESWREKPSPRIIPGLSSLHIKTFGIETNAQNSTCPWLNRRLLNLFQRQQHFLAPVFWISGLMTTWIIHPPYFRFGLKRSGLITKVLKEKQTNYSERATEEGVPCTPRQGSTLPLHAAALCSLMKVADQ